MSAPADHRRPALFTGLSARLLALTVAFVMLAEVLVYIPSISRFRRVYFEEQITKGSLVMLAIDAASDREIGGAVAENLLVHTGAHAIVLKTPERRMLMLSGDMPPPTDAVVDLRDIGMADWVIGAFATLIQGGNRVLRVIDAAPGQPLGSIEVVLDEAPLRKAMLAFSWRILTLSIIISLFTAGLVYISLHWLMVRPILRMTDSIARFRASPEDQATTPPPRRRRDEIGWAQGELAAMQGELRAALRQKAHLAALGSAVAKINHDLRNTLATAVIASDRLASIDDPEVRKVTPRLYAAIDRAIALCSQTLTFVQGARHQMRPSRFTADDLISDLEAMLRSDSDASVDGLHISVSGRDVLIAADRDQFYRALANLTLNAAQAGARRIAVEVLRVNDVIRIDITDDGSGIPDAVRARLFEPFAGSSRPDGTGLGLSIAREIVRGHGGDLRLLDTGPEGTRFRIELAAPPVERA